MLIRQEDEFQPTGSDGSAEEENGERKTMVRGAGRRRRIIVSKDFNPAWNQYDAIARYFYPAPYPSEQGHGEGV